MSKELIEQLRDLANCRHDDFTIGYEAADRIEQLEAERYQLREHVKMLRSSVEQGLDDMGENGHCVCQAAKELLQEALAATEPKP